MQGEYFALRLTPLPVWRERSNVAGQQHLVGGDRLAGTECLDSVVEIYFILNHNFTDVIMLIKNLYLVEGVGFYLVKGVGFYLVKGFIHYPGEPREQREP